MKIHSPSTTLFSGQRSGQRTSYVQSTANLNRIKIVCAKKFHATAVRTFSKSQDIFHAVAMILLHLATSVRVQLQTRKLGASRSGAKDWEFANHMSFCHRDSICPVSSSQNNQNISKQLCKSPQFLLFFRGRFASSAHAAGPVYRDLAITS